MDVIELRNSDEQAADGKGRITYVHIRDDGTRVESPIPFFDLKLYFAGDIPLGDRIIEMKRWYRNISKSEKERILENERKMFRAIPPD